MGLVSRYIAITFEEREMHNYESKADAELHDKFMTSSDWVRRDVYEHKEKIYQISERKTQVIK